MNVTDDLLHALRRDICPPPEHIFATEVQVPSDASVRFLDAVSMNIHARPFETMGYELKVSRGDWNAELRKDGKSDPARAVCDRFSFVFGDFSIYSPDEVPDGCGIIEAQPDGSLVVKRQAPRPNLSPASLAVMPRRFLAAFLRRAVEEDRPGFLRRALADAEARGREKGRNEQKRRSILAPSGKPRDHARASLDDGLPLDLP